MIVAQPGGEDGEPDQQDRRPGHGVVGLGVLDVSPDRLQHPQRVGDPLDHARVSRHQARVAVEQMMATQVGRGGRRRLADLVELDPLVVADGGSWDSVVCSVAGRLGVGPGRWPAGLSRHDLRPGLDHAVEVGRDLLREKLRHQHHVVEHLLGEVGSDVPGTAPGILELGEPGRERLSDPVAIGEHQHEQAGRFPAGQPTAGWRPAQDRVHGLQQLHHPFRGAPVQVIDDQQDRLPPPGFPIPASRHQRRPTAQPADHVGDLAERVVLGMQVQPAERSRVPEQDPPNHLAEADQAGDHRQDAGPGLDPGRRQ